MSHNRTQVKKDAMATTETRGNAASKKQGETTELLESLAETLESNGARIVWLDVQQRVLKSTGSAQ